MCGFCGVADFGGRPVEAEAIRAMLSTLAHRGPDGQGTWMNASERQPSVIPSVGLGHARLRVIDPSPSADQPMTNEDGSLWLVFNGEIYNFYSLRQSLEAAGHAFRSRTDSEVILHLYEEQGPDCVSALEGMFAFALWDGRRRRLLLARDRLGKKPLFYAQQGERIAFASEAKALLKIVPSAIDHDAIWRYFYYGYVPTPRTWYRPIRALPAGHTIVMEGDGRAATPRRYWDVSMKANEQRPPLAPTELRTLVLQAVARRLVADVPLGVLLSGGLDSTVIVAAMRALGVKTIDTFTLRIAGDPAFDEGDAAAASARYFGTRHHEFLVEPDAAQWIDQLCWHYDGPFADSSALPTFLVARYARQTVTVALSGDGGDEVFAGYVRFLANLWAGRLPDPLLALGRRLLGRAPAELSYHSRWRKARRFFDYAGRSFHERCLHDTSVFNDDLEQLVGHPPGGGRWDRLDALRPHLGVAGTCGSRLAEQLYLNLKTYLPDDLLVKTDRASMAHGLEVRSPFLDLRLLETMAAQPDALKLRHGQTKRILRAAFAKELPSHVLRRPKRGFGIPVGRWLRGPLVSVVRETLLDSQAALRRYVDGAYVERLAQRHLAGEIDCGPRVWSLVMFERWLRCERAWRDGATASAGGAMAAATAARPGQGSVQGACIQSERD